MLHKLSLLRERLTYAVDALASLFFIFPQAENWRHHTYFQGQMHMISSPPWMPLGLFEMVFMTRWVILILF